MSDNIKVVVKVRPLISREIDQKQTHQWHIKNNTLYQLDQTGKEIVGNGFTFDKVYDKDCENVEVFNDIAKPIVEAAISGFNGTIFAYGQTSSGKTYTMTGTEDSPGIIPLSVYHLFKLIKSIPDREFYVRVSYIEIYNEMVNDLLNINNLNIKIQEHGVTGVKVNATEKATSCPEEVLEVMKEGDSNRQTGATNMNEGSSRSHSIFQITIESRKHREGDEEEGCVNVSQLNLVDLAGSERAGQTGSTGMRFKEGTHINKSLSALGLVIKQLAENPIKFVSYRDSKLTRILQNSLGGNAKTSIICSVTPAAVEETISTLQFANRAKAIKNKPEVNAVATTASKIHDLTKKLKTLLSEIENKKHLEETNTNLQKQVDTLRKLLLNGFEQHSRVDMLGSTRRKWQQPPRRVTISTLLPIDEDPGPTVPRFCTPMLKYNAMTLNTDFVPVQSSSSLLNIPEEKDRMITPPPYNKKDNDDLVINLDSDEDTESCSPHHRCHRNTKTPPCVLKQNLAVAEKSLNDIIELTKREKIYAPDVVELMEKLDHILNFITSLKEQVELMEKLENNLNVITRLEEQVNTLTLESKQKDSELDLLKNMIKRAEDDVKSVTNLKSDLEKRCEEYGTKLTDCEVSYDNLLKKSKSREQELLSLLNDQGTPRKEDPGKMASKPLERELFFMNMSKDISLVNSDNESNTGIAHDHDTSQQIQDMVADMQSQLTKKNQMITDLEANLFAQNQQIKTLEDSSLKLQSTIQTLEDKITHVENENCFLKTSMDSLNCTIQSQKATIDAANNDIKSYNSLIQELQIKLTNKDNIQINLNDSLLESMVANEEMFLANNENMRNITNSFRQVLEEKNKKIEKLHSQNQDSSEILDEISEYKKQVEVKDTQIKSLVKEAENLKNQINENNLILNKLMSIEQEKDLQIAEIKKENASLQKQNNKYALEIDQLEEINKSIALINSKKELMEKELIIQNQELTKTIDELSEKIHKLEKSNKNDLILLSENQKHLSNSKSTLDKLKALLRLLNCESSEVPEEFDHLDSYYTAIYQNLNILETATSNILQLKEISDKKVVDVENYMSILTDEHQEQVGRLEKNKNELIGECKSLSENINIHQKEINEIREELDIKNNNIIDLETKFNDLKENNENLRNELLSKDNMVSLLQNTISQKNSEARELDDLKLTFKSSQDSFEQVITEKNHEVETLKAKLNELQSTIDKNQEVYNQTIEKKNKDIADLTNDISHIKTQRNNRQEEIQNLTAELQSVTEKKEALMQNILSAVTELLISVENSKNSFPFESENHASDTYDRIKDTIHKISVRINTKPNAEIEPTEDFMKILSQAKMQISELTEKNVNLMNNYSSIDLRNQELKAEIENLKLISENLTKSNELIQELKLELKTKSQEIHSMENKAQELRNEFIKFDFIMKQQMQEMEIENERLKETIEKRICNSNEKELEGKASASVVGLVEKKSPQSLLTICCSQIMENMHSNDSEYASASTSKSSVAICNLEPPKECSKCIVLSLQLDAVNEENQMLLIGFKHLETINERLVQEQEDVRKELQLLVEPAQELQKRITNHRTNLSTLTATSYAENKLLHSQLRVLKHHHTRCLHVCQRDIPAVKTQLYELMSILKGSANVDKQNSSFKRYSLPDVLDSNSSICNFKYDSTLDGDLLMLDTNFTMTTCPDTTLTGPDQSCLEVTQINYDNEVACQTNDLDNEIDPCVIYSQMEIVTNDNKKMFKEIEDLKAENNQLKQHVTLKTHSLKDIGRRSLSPTRTYLDDSTLKLNREALSASSSVLLTPDSCFNCKHEEQLRLLEEKLRKEVDVLSEKLEIVKEQKNDIEKKYSDLTLEVPTIESLVRKVNVLEKEYNNKVLENTKVTKELEHKNNVIKNLQEENVTLSTEIMDTISKEEDLRRELQELKDKTDLDSANNCSLCPKKDYIINTLQNKLKLEEHSVLNRSLSDSESSSRFNKICTLQNELLESKEDCKKITQEVATIKNHLDRSNMDQPMDLDESINDASIFNFSKGFDYEQPVNRFALRNIPEEDQIEKDSHIKDAYKVDKIDCFNFYVEKTGDNKENIHDNVKIIEVMKMLYENLMIKHSNEIENIANKLKHFEESKSQLQGLIHTLSTKNTEIVKELEEKQSYTKNMIAFLNQLKNNITIISGETHSPSHSGDSNKLVTMYRETFLKMLDAQFGINSVDVFDSVLNCVINKQQIDFRSIIDANKKLTQEVNISNESLKKLQMQLSEKESEFDQLRAQNEKIKDIANAVTSDLAKKEQDLKKVLTEVIKELEHKKIYSDDMDLTLPAHKQVQYLVRLLITENDKQIDRYMRIEIECQKSNSAIEQKDHEMGILKKEFLETNKTIQSQKSLLANYQSQLNENKFNSDKINELKSEILEKQTYIDDLQKQLSCKLQNSELETKYAVLSQKLSQLQDENKNLTTVNEMIKREKDSYAAELEKCRAIIQQNKIEMEEMTSNILVLRESLKENVSVIESLRAEAKYMMEQQRVLREELEGKCQECSRLEVNIKTHEKTAEIQSRMIMRLQKQKEEDDNLRKEKEAELEELERKYMAAQTECESLKATTKSWVLDKGEGEGSDKLTLKNNLKLRVSESAADEDCQKRLSVEAMTDNIHRRRQSLHDSKRMFGDEMSFEDHNQMHAMFGSRDRPDDLFMDVDEDANSTGSTPLRLSKGRESLLCKGDQPEPEEPPSRPSSVQATRRRRQSTHDLHRAALLQTPDLQDNLLLKVTEANTSIKFEGLSTSGSDSESRLSLEREVVSLRARVRELDDECDTCALYLREREADCAALTDKRRALENQVAELQEKLALAQNGSHAEAKRNTAHACVNTDEDWANLHSVVVDRMSFDAEVEKNKKLTRVIEELRYKKQELKNILAKMQKSMEKHAGHKETRELEITKSELDACKLELQELRERYKELDDECETCAEYLRERDEQCRKLREAKAALEAKLQEYHSDSGIAQSVRKRRHTAHDRNRADTGQANAATEIGDDFLSYQVERDDSSQTRNEALERELSTLKATLEKTKKEKASLELVLASRQPAAVPTMFVATGSAIVQSQQITDVMKENYKLKKMNTKLIQLCKKRGKSHEQSNLENEEPVEQAPV